MTALILTPCVCSAGVLAAAFLGVRPIEFAIRLPFATALCWACA
jgi:hypothetical protein